MFASAPVGMGAARVSDTGCQSGHLRKAEWEKAEVRSLSPALVLALGQGKEGIMVLGA